MKYSLIALALVTPALLAPVAASAQELSYDYVELGYNRYDGDAEADGLGVNGSFGLGEDFHLFGGYTDFDLDNDILDETDLLDDDFAEFDGDAQRWHLGVGYNRSVSDSMDLIARVAYQKTHVSGFGSDDGGFAEVGVRALMGPRFEGWAMAGYEDLENQSGEVYGRLGGQFRFNPSWGIVADAKFIDSDQVYFIGPRLSF